MSTADVAHGLPIDTIIILIDHKGNYGGAVKLIGRDWCGREAAGSHEEDDSRKIEEGRSGIRNAPGLFDGIEQGKYDKKGEVGYGLLWLKDIFV